MLGIFRVHLQQLIKNWTKLALFSKISGVLTHLSCSRTDLIVENALLNMQTYCGYAVLNIGSNIRILSTASIVSTVIAVGLL